MLPLPDSTILLPIFGYKTIRANHIFYDIFIVAEMITGNFNDIFDLLSIKVIGIIMYLFWYSENITFLLSSVRLQLF